MGPMANALELGCDCLGEIRYRDADLVELARRADPPGERHLPARGGRRHPLEAHRRRRRRRGAARPPLRRLVHLHRRQLRVRLLLVPRPGRLARLRGQAHRHPAHDRGRSPGTAGPHSTEVAPGLAAPNHQHFLCARLDMDVDGTANRVVEVEWRARPARARTTRTARSSARVARCSPARPARSGGEPAGGPPLARGVGGAHEPHGPRRRRTSSCPARTSRPRRTRTPASCGARASSTQHLWVTPQRAGRALSRRATTRTSTRRRRPAALDGEGPLARRRGRRALVRLRRPPRAAPGGLAGDAGGAPAASSCARSASSTATPRSTCRRRQRALRAPRVAPAVPARPQARPRAGAGLERLAAVRAEGRRPRRLVLGAQRRQAKPHGRCSPASGTLASGRPSTATSTAGRALAIV